MKLFNNQQNSALKLNWRALLGAITLSLLSLYAFSQEALPNKSVKGIPWKGNDGIVVTTSQILQNQQYMESHHLLSEAKNRYIESNEDEILEQTKSNPESPAVASYANPNYRESNPDAALSSFSIGTTFDAVTHANVTQGWTPPDPMVACGPTQLIASVNGRLRVFSKAGALLQDFNADVLYSSVLGGSNIVDPRVRYDPTSKRFIFSGITIQGSNNFVLLAVSSDSEITGTGSFTFFSFRQDLVGPQPNIDNGLFADYETLGVDSKAVYIGCNMFNSTSHTSVFVINKKQLLTGHLKVTAFRNVGNNANGGMWTAQGVSNDNPTSSQGYFIGVDYNSTGLLVVRRINTPGGTPTISANFNITVPTTSIPLSVPNSGGSSMDAIDNRLLLATMHKKGTGAYTLWCSHTITVNSSGVGTASGDRDAVRWYQIGTLGTTPSLLQSGTLFDNSAAKTFYWMGTLCMNTNGTAMISCSKSSASTDANGAIAAHFPTGALGSTSAPMQTTTNNTGYGGFRWGDYSASVLDPTDNTTFWCAHEYVSGGDYVVRIVQVTATKTPLVAQTTEGNSLTTSALRSPLSWTATLFPNPSDHTIQIHIDGNSNQTFKMSIVDLNGKTILEKTYSQGANSWSEDISNLSSGIYFANISADDGSAKQIIRFEKN